MKHVIEVVRLTIGLPLLLLGIACMSIAGLITHGNIDEYLG